MWKFLIAISQSDNFRSLLYSQEWKKKSSKSLNIRSWNKQMCLTEYWLSNSWQSVFYQSADKIDQQIVAAVVSNNNSDTKLMTVMIVIN